MLSRLAPDNLILEIDDQKRGGLEHLHACIDKTFPLPHRFALALPFDVANLSRLLTSDRPSRNADYMGQDASLSAYLRYFLPWNVFRLCRLNLCELIHLQKNDVIVDIGSGPATFAIALWISAPNLRSMPLHFFCVDKSAKTLAAGKKLFAAFAGNDSPWRISAVKAPIDFAGGRSKGDARDSAHLPPAALVCAINVCNEIFWSINQADNAALAAAAKKMAAYLLRFAAPRGCALVVEPGIPRCGQYLSHMRAAFLETGMDIAAPCFAAAPCPMHGGKRGEKWCHFAFDTQGAPAALQALSIAAKLPKERAVLSFLLASKNAGDAVAPAPSSASIRLVSDMFRLPDGNFARYACGEAGLILVRGKKEIIENKNSGMAIIVTRDMMHGMDKKTGAVIVDLPEHIRAMDNKPPGIIAG